MLARFTPAILLTLVCCRAGAVEATYTVGFETLWNQSSHPNNYPSSAHFSPLIGAVHSNNVSFWAPGQSATTGIERVAEVGSNSVFRGEINASILSGEAIGLVEIPRNLFSGQSGTSGSFTVTSGHSLVTFATMVAPSSDWFVGVHGLDLREGAGFAEEVVIDFGSFYDAGTEEGNGFSLSNPATNPRGVITHVTGGAAAEPFVGDAAIPLPPIARLTLTRQSIAGLPGDFNGDGSVDASDLSVWRNQFGQSASGLSADANEDGRVDSADYTVWRDALPSGTLAVPEPGTVWIVLSLVALSRTWRHQ